MKQNFILPVFVLLTTLLISCKKSAVEETQLNESNGATISNLAPLKYHAVSFTTNYKTLPGMVPPFSFTKTLYPDSRVATLKMLSRSIPNHPSNKQRAYDWNVNFTYSTKASKMTGIRKLLEYSIDPIKKTGVVTEIKTETLVYDFAFNNNGFCASISTKGNMFLNTLLGDESVDTTIQMIQLYGPGYYSEISPNTETIFYYFENQNATPPAFSTWTPYNGPTENQLGITYQPKYNGKTLLYLPTQYTLSQEYSLLEVMQWLPIPKIERKAISLEFWTPARQKVTQRQSYYNHVYDKNGCLISYTYGDNVQQKITWK